MTDFLPTPVKRPIEPTQVIPAPQPQPAAAPTVLISSRTIPEPDPDQPKPKRPRREKARKVRLAKRLKRRPKPRPEPEVEAEEELDEEVEGEGEEPGEDDESPARRRFTLRRAPSPDTGPRTLSQKQRGRLKAIAVTAVAAGIGWQLYLGPFLTATIHTIGQANPNWAVGIGLGAVAAGFYLDFFLRGGTSQNGAIRVRDITGWGLIFATIARIPAGTALLALALYAPGRI